MYKLSIHKFTIATPIPKIDIISVMKPLDVHDFLPKMEYMLKGATVSSEAKDLQKMLESFLGENQELINNGVEFKDSAEMKSFTDGFRNRCCLLGCNWDSFCVHRYSPSYPQNFDVLAKFPSLPRIFFTVF